MDTDDRDDAAVMTLFEYGVWGSEIFQSEDLADSGLTELRIMAALRRLETSGRLSWSRGAWRRP